MLRNYINLYSLINKLSEWDVYPISYQKQPIEIILSKSKAKTSEQIISSASKLNMSDIEKFATKTLKFNRMRLLGKAKLSYLNRETTLKLQKPVGDILPVTFIHTSKEIPILLK